MAASISPNISGGRRLDGHAIFGGNGRQLSEPWHSGRGGGLQFAEHLIEAVARCAQDKDARRLIADIAEGMAPAAIRRPGQPGAFSVLGRPISRSMGRRASRATLQSTTASAPPRCLGATNGVLPARAMR
jgi:hypothetical protein